VSGANVLHLRLEVGGKGRCPDSEDKEEAGGEAGGDSLWDLRQAWGRRSGVEGDTSSGKEKTVERAFGHISRWNHWGSPDAEREILFFSKKGPEGRDGPRHAAAKEQR